MQPSENVPVAKKTARQYLVLFVKLALTVIIGGMIVRLVLERENMAELRARLNEIQPVWVVAAAFSQVLAVLAGALRWRALLIGQGVRASLRHLYGTMLIGRYFGAVTPSGIGLQGFMIFDMATRTGKVARATASVAISMVAGWLGFGIVVIIASIYGARYIGRDGVILINAGCVGLIIVALTLLAKPRVFQSLSRRLTGGVPNKLQSLVDAVCAYDGRGGLLALAVGLSFLVHLGHIGVYLCAAHALGLPLGMGDVFFVTALQILATLVPITPNGMGVREAAAVGLYTIVGVPPGLAVLVPLVGFAAEMSISVLGGPVMLLRRSGYAPEITVESPEREEELVQKIIAAAVEVPLIGRGFVLGFGGGMLGGMLVGVAEGVVVLLSSRTQADFGVLWYGAIAYGLLGAFLGGGGGFVFALFGRLIRKPMSEEARTYGRWVGLVFAVLGFGLGVFRILRDVYREELVLKSREGVLVLAGVALAAAVTYLLLATVFRKLTERRFGRFMLTIAGTPLLVAALVGGLIALDRTRPVAVNATSTRQIPPAPMIATNIIVIVVDTLRADRLPAYGYTRGRTPNLDAFVAESVRYDQHFANASWTRPSFASILTGRYASSHSVMSKADALPDAIVTLPEALSANGFYTSGFVTNFNVAPYFNFQQGFDEYRYLEPTFVLGANDAQQKLLISQTARRVVERFSPARPGSAYQDASVVNREVLSWLDQRPESEAPFFLFAAYMDPHDPYFTHPYDGRPGYARATHQHPAPEEAAHLSALYDGEITYWDAQFGRLIAELRRRNIYDNTLIMITSDHGEEFMEHGGYWHGTTLYDEQVRVPMIVRYPMGRRGGEVVATHTESIDIMPTVLRESGVTEPIAGVQGVHLDEQHGAVFAEESHEGNVLASVRMNRGRSTVKVITANAGNPRGLATTETYRMDLDPGEYVNLAEEDVALTDAARAELGRVQREARVGAVRQQNITEGNGADSAQAAALLRSLGYTGDGEEREPSADPEPARDAAN
jgi:arylsulfatase A-like enzyme/uncharacterized membrane protein YbhN (UPF0104 family)